MATASIQGIYVALFGRPADPAGLAFFNTATKNGADLTAIGDLSSTAEYKGRFKDQNNVQIVTSIYQSLFNRDPETAGLEFFVAKLNADASAINTIAIDILNGATGDDKKIVDNKIASADAFTKALDTAVEIASYSGSDAVTKAQDFLKAVTTTAATSTQVSDAVKGLATVASTGNTLTVDADKEVSPTSTITAQKSSDKDDTVNVNAPTADITAVAKIDGGFGNDTVNINTKGNEADLSGTNAVAGADAKITATPEYTSVEKIGISAAGGNANRKGSGDHAGSDASIALNLEKATSLKEVVITSDVGGVLNSSTKAGGKAAVSLTNVKLGTQVTLKDKVEDNVTVAYKGADGSSDSAKLILNSVGTVAGDVTMAKIETVEISNTGTSDVSNKLKLSDAKTLSVTGDGTLGITSFGGKAETIDASKFEGNLTANVTSEDALKTFTGSAKSDKVTVDTVGATADLAVNGGAGADVITVANGAADKALSLTGGAGADKFVFGGIDNIKEAAKADFEKSLVTIADFNKAEDVIDVKALFAVNARTTLDNNEKAQIEGAADLHAAVSLAAGFAGSGKSAVFNYKGDAYIFADTNGGATLSNGDTLIKVTGLADVADLKDGNFVV